MASSLAGIAQKEEKARSSRRRRRDTDADADVLVPLVPHPLHVKVERLMLMFSLARVSRVKSGE